MSLDPAARTGRVTALDAVLGLGVLVLLKATAALAMPVVAALLLALLASSTSETLQRRGVPAALAAALATFVPAGLLGAAVAAAAPSAVGWWRDIRAAFAHLAATLEPSAGGSGLPAAGLRWLLARDWRGAYGSGLAREIGPWALQGISVLMLTFFLLWAQRSLLAGLLQAAPDRRVRVRLLGALRDARRGAGGYLATMSWINLGLALLTGAGLAGLGIPHVPAWIGVIFGLLYVPYLGPAAIALLLATAASGAGLAAVAAPPLLFLGLHMIEAQFFSPWLMGRRLGVGRPALLLAVMAGGWAWGVAGGVLAVPLLIAARALVTRHRGAAFWKVLLAAEAPRAPSLADSAARVLENRRPDSPPPRVHRMPPPLESPAECVSPTSPKPIPPRSTASR